jgi:hypothetical protein
MGAPKPVRQSKSTPFKNVELVSICILDICLPTSVCLSSNKNLVTKYTIFFLNNHIFSVFFLLPVCAFIWPGFTSKSILTYVNIYMCVTGLNRSRVPLWQASERFPARCCHVLYICICVYPYNIPLFFYWRVHNHMASEVKENERSSLLPSISEGKCTCNFFSFLIQDGRLMCVCVYVCMYVCCPQESCDGVHLPFKKYRLPLGVH